MTKHKFVTVVALAALLALVLGSGVTVTQAKGSTRVLDPGKLYVPAITAELFESAADISEVSAAALPERTPFWVDLVDAEIVPNDGEGVYVAILDTGLLPQWPVLLSQANVAVELGKGFTHDVYWDDTVGDLMVGPLRDDRGFITNLASGHGTHLASTVVGFNRNNDYWVRGVAPKATIIPVLVLDAWTVSTPHGEVQLSGGTWEMVSAGVYYIADLADDLDGPVVINMSLGGSDPSPMVEAAINYAIGKGVIVVASAGNYGPDGMGYPGGFPQVISAAAGGWATMFAQEWRADVPEALNTRDALGNNWQIYLEDFSSRPNKDLGQKARDLDVTTPGAWVVGPYKPVFSDAVSYYYVSGTSMAASHVTAIASLVLQSHPNLNQTSMEFILKTAAQGLPLPADDAIVAYFTPGVFYSATWSGGDYGAGFLQADAALAKAGVFAR